MKYLLNGREVTRDEFMHGAPGITPGQPPACITDATFLAGHCNGSQFEKTPYIGDYYRCEAEAAGVSTKGKVYLSQLAEYPGDPRAWVDGRGDVQRVCEERGWGCGGSVNVQGAAMPPEPEIALADDIAESLANDLVAASDGDVNPSEARQKVIDKHAPKFRRGKPKKEIAHVSE
jgi:hypothetical protein